jgi:hypothetical protein
MGITRIVRIEPYHDNTFRLHIRDCEGALHTETRIPLDKFDLQDLAREAKQALKELKNEKRNN